MRVFLHTLTIFVASLFINGAVAAPHRECHPGDVWPEEGDCHAWYQCVEPGVKVRQYCGPGTAWNRHTNTCDDQTKVCH